MTSGSISLEQMLVVRALNYPTALPLETSVSVARTTLEGSTTSKMLDV
jgi:hypothetical protein